MTVSIPIIIVKSVKFVGTSRVVKVLNIIKTIKLIRVVRLVRAVSESFRSYDMTCIKCGKVRDPLKFKTMASCTTD